MALNGAGAIHDFELAMIGATTESVARYVSTGEFGLWRETGRFNEAAVAAQRQGIGLGEALGRMIEEEKFPFRETSVLAAAVRHGVPATVHVGIGQDIVHMHPNFDAAATGAASYSDFLIFVETARSPGGRRVCEHRHRRDGAGNFPEGRDHGAERRPISGASTSSISPRRCSIWPRLGEKLDREPTKSEPRYYFRPYKSVLVRTVADGGESYYVQGDHRRTVPALYDQIVMRAKT